MSKRYIHTSAIAIVCILASTILAFSADHDIDTEQYQSITSFGISILYPRDMTYSLKDEYRSIILHFPNHEPLGILGISKGEPMSLSEFQARMKKNILHVVKRIRTFKVKSQLIALAESESAEDNNISYTYCILTTGLYINYVGPPENYKYFRSVVRNKLQFPNHPPKNEQTSH